MHEGKEFELKTKYAKIKSCMEIKCEIDTDYLPTRAHGFSSIEQDLSLAFSFSLYHPFQERRVRTVAYSSSVNLS
jgi:hypothetical protein